MKKKVLLSFIVITTMSLTGCISKEIGSKANLEKGKFTIVCESKTEDYGNMKSQNKTTYHFNEEQYAINYSITTTQKFKDKAQYNEYKKAQEESIKDNSSETVKYSLKSNDTTKTLVFTFAITDIDITKAPSEEEKEQLKARTILKNQAKGTVCKTEGIKESELK